jgi:hypothetical protein
MNSAATGAATNLGGTVKDPTTTTYQGRPAVDLRIPDAQQDSKKLRAPRREPTHNASRPVLPAQCFPPSAAARRRSDTPSHR